MDIPFVILTLTGNSYICFFNYGHMHSFCYGVSWIWLHDTLITSHVFASKGHHCLELTHGISSNKEKMEEKAKNSNIKHSQSYTSEHVSY